MVRSMIHGAACRSFGVENVVPSCVYLASLARAIAAPGSSCDFVRPSKPPSLFQLCTPCVTKLREYVHLCAIESTAAKLCVSCLWGGVERGGHLPDQFLGDGQVALCLELRQRRPLPPDYLYIKQIAFEAETVWRETERKSERERKRERERASATQPTSGTTYA